MNLQKLLKPQFHIYLCMTLVCFQHSCSNKFETAEKPLERVKIINPIKIIDFKYNDNQMAEISIQNNSCLTDGFSLWIFDDKGLGFIKKIEKLSNGLNHIQIEYQIISAEEIYINNRNILQIDEKRFESGYLNIRIFNDSIEYSNFSVPKVRGEYGDDLTYTVFAINNGLGKPTERTNTTYDSIIVFKKDLNRWIAN